MPTIKTEHSLDVQAKPEKLWDILTDFKSWIEWRWTSYFNPMPTNAGKDGSTFVVELGGHKWNMTIEQSERPNRITWLARQTGLSTLHEWEFLEQGGITRVVTRERMSGWMLFFVYPIVKRNVQKTDERWLSDLKSRAEKIQAT
jgi:hypothetical protein